MQDWIILYRVTLFNLFFIIVNLINRHITGGYFAINQLIVSTHLSSNNSFVLQMNLHCLRITNVFDTTHKCGKSMTQITQENNYEF